jgi:DNA mismatch repair ATPase MutS
MKNKNIFIIPLAIIIVICVVYTNMKNHNNNNNIIPEKISVSTTKNTSKNMISNLSDYPDKILEIKKEILNNEKQYVITG